MKTELEPYALFRKGYDTLEIANLMKITEPEVVKAIDAERAARSKFRTEHPKAKNRNRLRLIMFNEFGRPIWG
jgi:hypothetical protein